jgi:hypothetical protein
MRVRRGVSTYPTDVTRKAIESKGTKLSFKMGRIRKSTAEHITENTEKCGGHGDVVPAGAVTRGVWSALSGPSRGED